MWPGDSARFIIDTASAAQNPVRYAEPDSKLLKAKQRSMIYRVASILISSVDYESLPTVDKKRPIPLRLGGMSTQWHVSNGLV